MRHINTFNRNDLNTLEKYPVTLSHMTSSSHDVLGLRPLPAAISKNTTCVFWFRELISSKANDSVAHSSHEDSRKVCTPTQSVLTLISMIAGDCLNPNY